MTDDHAIEAGAIEVVHRPSDEGYAGPDFFDMSAGHVRELAELMSEPSVVKDDDIDIDALASLAEPWKDSTATRPS